MSNWGLPNARYELGEMTVPLLFPTLWKDLCVRGPWVAAQLTASESTRAQVRPPQGQDYCPKSALGHRALQHTRADRPGP